MEFKVSVFLFVNWICFVTSARLSCEYAVDRNQLYTCSSFNSFTTTEDDSSILSVLGDHLDGKWNEDVQQVIIQNASVEYFPNMFEIFFPNLESIVIKNSGLKHLRRSGFHDLTHLKYLNLSMNEIEIIGPGIFEMNSQLQELEFSSNKISRLSSDILSLESLIRANFDNNICINMTLDVVEEGNQNLFKDIVNSKCVVSETDKVEQLNLELKNAMTQLENMKRLEKVEPTSGTKDSSDLSAVVNNDVKNLNKVLEGFKKENKKLADVIQHERLLTEDLKVQLENSVNQTKVLEETVQKKDEEIEEIKKGHLKAKQEMQTYQRINNQLMKKITLVEAQMAYYANVEKKIKKYEEMKKEMKDSQKTQKTINSSKNPNMKNKIFF